MYEFSVFRFLYFFFMFLFQVFCSNVFVFEFSLQAFCSRFLFKSSVQNFWFLFMFSVLFKYSVQGFYLKFCSRCLSFCWSVLFKLSVLSFELPFSTEVICSSLRKLPPSTLYHQKKKKIFLPLIVFIFSVWLALNFRPAICVIFTFSYLFLRCSTVYFGSGYVRLRARAAREQRCKVMQVAGAISRRRIAGGACGPPRR